MIIEHPILDTERQLARYLLIIQLEHGSYHDDCSWVTSVLQGRRLTCGVSCHKACFEQVPESKLKHAHEKWLVYRALNVQFFSMLCRTASCKVSWITCSWCLLSMSSSRAAASLMSKSVSSMLLMPSSYQTQVSLNNRFHHNTLNKFSLI